MFSILNTDLKFFPLCLKSACGVIICIRVKVNRGSLCGKQQLTKLRRNEACKVGVGVENRRLVGHSPWPGWGYRLVRTALPRLFPGRKKKRGEYKSATRVVAQDKDNRRRKVRRLCVYVPMAAIRHRSATGEKLPSDKDNRAFYFAFRDTIFRMTGLG